MNKKSISRCLFLILAFTLTLSIFLLVKFFIPSFLDKNLSFTLGFLLLIGFIAGKIFSIFSLPELSGFLFVGVICGPFILSVIGSDEIQSLGPINNLALALIAIQAGSEISLSFLKQGFKSITLVIISQLVIIPLGMTGVFLFAVNFLDFHISDAHVATLVAAILFATLSISKAPADTLAILGETKVKGKFANHVLGVVVLIDILVIILFQVVLLVVKPLVIPMAFFDIGKIFNLFEELISSLAAGFSVGLIFILWFSLKRFYNRESILFIVLASFGIAAMCNYLRYDALLVFLTGGFVVRNMSKKEKYLVETVSSISHGVMIVFFATAGAMLDLNILKEIWPFALLLAFSRILFTWASTNIGHLLAKDNLQTFKYTFTAYISQAGVTLVLAQSAAHALASIGTRVAALATAVVAINEIIGPIAFKIALKKSSLAKNSTASER